MRKIVVISMITLDGVMQGPGGPGEDTSNGFAYGGWTAGFGDEVFAERFAAQMQPAELLLGRRTFDIFEAFWPEHAEGWPGINESTKYVVSETRDAAGWINSVFLHGLSAVKALRESDGPELHVWGSGRLIQALLENDLVDELRLTIFPVTIGEGKRLFDGGAIPASFSLTECVGTPSGLIMANYERAGELTLGTVGD
jgi:dihydrofolate reductase